ncbi:competence type IV pilus minor pilin ComGD [Staphylococcus sp. 11262D007BW]
MQVKGGFTLIEMLIVISIITLILGLSFIKPPKLFTEYQIKLQAALLTSKLDFYQAEAIKNKSDILLVFRKKQNDIKVVMLNQTKPQYIPLTPLKLNSHSNLDNIKFDRNGNINKFGTLKFNYLNEKFSLIYHIEQGRYRLSFSK